MKQKYEIIKDDEKNALILREFAELDKDAMSMLCEETYAADTVTAALGAGRDDLAHLLRTRNLYPPAVYINKIVDSVISLYEAGGMQSTEILIEDADFFAHNRTVIEASEGIVDDDTPDIDELLDDTDDIDDEFGADESIANIGSNASIKIADDESLDIEDEG